MEMNKGYYVGDKFRRNHLSLKPGGSTIKVIYENHFKVYDKIKYPVKYMQAVVGSDLNAIEITCDGVTYWKKSEN